MKRSARGSTNWQAASQRSSERRVRRSVNCERGSRPIKSDSPVSIRRQRGGQSRNFGRGQEVKDLGNRSWNTVSGLALQSLGLFSYSTMRWSSMLYVTGVIWSVLATVSAHLNLYLDQQEVRRLLGNCFLLLHDSVSWGFIHAALCYCRPLKCTMKFYANVCQL